MDALTKQSEFRQQLAEDRMGLPEKTEFRFRLTEALLTGVAIAVAIYLYCATQEQVRESQRQVTASQEQNTILRESTRKELKAYVNTSPLPNRLPILVKNQFVYTIANFGQTPAYNVDANAEYSFVDKLNPPNEEHITFGRGYAFTLDKGRVEQCIGEYKGIDGAADRMHFIVGKIRYTDIFNDTTIVTFRYRFITAHGKFFTDYNRVEVRPKINEQTQANKTRAQTTE